MNYMFEEMTEEQEEQLRDEYEFYDEWKDSEARDEGIDLETYNLSRRMKNYGLDEEDMCED